MPPFASTFAYVFLSFRAEIHGGNKTKETPGKEKGEIKREKEKKGKKKKMGNGKRRKGRMEERRAQKKHRLKKKPSKEAQES